MDMRDGHRDDDEETVFHDTLHQLVGIHIFAVQFLAIGGVALDQSLDPPVDVLQEHGLRAGPSAPQAAKDRGDKEEREAEAGDEEEGHPQVLGGKAQAEEVEASVDDIEEDGGVPVDRYPRQEDVDPDQ